MNKVAAHFLLYLIMTSTAAYAKDLDIAGLEKSIPGGTQSVEAADHENPNAGLNKDSREVKAEDLIDLF